MFDHDEASQNGHIHQPSESATDDLPRDLGPIHARLAHEADGWARRLPDAGPLANHAQSLAAGRATLVAPHIEETAQPDDTRAERGMSGVDLPAISLRRTPHPARRGRTVFALAAAVMIVVLMAAVFSVFAPGRGPATGKPTAGIQPTSTPLPTATPRPAFGPVTGSWQAVPGLTNVQGPVTLAPSNPSVVYEVVSTQTTNGEPVGQDAILRRSDDEGKTWHTLTLPTPADSSVAAWGPGAVLVSPADPNTLVVNVDTRMSYNVPQACPANLTMVYHPPAAGSSSAATTLAATFPSDGFQRCSIQYVSSDGGTSWAKVQFSGVHGGVDGLVTLAAQGSQLYGTVYANDQQTLSDGYRLVTSSDGIHWQPVDAALLSQVKYICGLMAVPTGTTLFANANTGGCESFSSTADELWRSDDAGAHWRDLGPLGSWVSILGAVEQGPYDAQPTLYVYTISKSDPFDLRLQVSTDGGYSWQSASTAGMPKEYSPFLQTAGTLSDGSVVVIFTSNAKAGPHTPVTLAFYSWHVGDSEWHQVAPNLPLASNEDLTEGWNQFLVTPSGGVHGALWHIQVNPTFPNSTISVTRYSS